MMICIISILALVFWSIHMAIITTQDASFLEKSKVTRLFYFLGFFSTMLVIILFPLFYYFEQVKKEEKTEKPQYEVVTEPLYKLKK